MSETPKELFGAAKASAEAKQSRAAVVPAEGPDETNAIYLGDAQDPWMGATYEEGWHHVKVAEHPASSGLPSNKLKFLRMGYEFAPTPPEYKAVMDEAKIWVMRIRQEVYDARQAAFREKARENREGSRTPQSPDMKVTQDVRKRTGLSDFGMADG